MKILFFLLCPFLASAQKLNLTDVLHLYDKKEDTTYLFSYIREKGFTAHPRTTDRYACFAPVGDGPFTETANFYLEGDSITSISFHSADSLNYDSWLKELKEQGFKEKYQQDIYTAWVKETAMVVVSYFRSKNGFRCEFAVISK